MGTIHDRVMVLIRDTCRRDFQAATAAVIGIYIERYNLQWRIIDVDCLRICLGSEA